ncbi:MAG: MarR family transcriptional regulator [Clostridiaceae bacterium]
MDIGNLIEKSSKLIKNNMNNSLEGFGLTYVQWKILKDIHTIEDINGDIEELTPLEIGKRVGVDKATLSSAINRMISNEWVEKIKNPLDKRSYYLLMTQKAISSIHKLEKIAEEAEQNLISGLSPQEAVLLKKYLNVVIENLK